MRLYELFSPQDFWDDAKHTLSPQVGAMIDKKFFGKTFPTEEMARKFIMRVLSTDVRPDMFKDRPNEKAIAAAAPIYFDGNAYRIGTVNSKPKITWNEIKIKPESRSEIANSAAAQANDYEIHFKIEYFKLAELLPSRNEDSYMNDPKEEKRISILADTILRNRWVTPLFVGEEEDESGKISRWIVEGQHRARALFYHLGLPTAPAYRFEIFD